MIEKIPNNNEKREITEGFIEAALWHAHKSNEGNNGIICRMNMKDLNQDIVDYFKEANENFFEKNESVAVKMLKIYSAGQGEHEVAMQKKAYELVNGADNKEELAKIPEILFYKKIKLSDETLIKKLEDEHVRVVDGMVDVIIMDYVEGEDFATHIYKKIITTHPNLVDLRQALEEGEDFHFEDIQERIEMAFNFARPGGKGVSETDRQFEKIKVAEDNMKKVLDYLRKMDDTLCDKKVIQKVENTIKLFAKNGFNHGDLHERNILLEKDKDGKIVDVYVIDYGMSSHSSNVDFVVDGEILSDVEFVNRYKSYTETKDEKNTKELTLLKRKLDSLSKRMNKELTAKIEEIVVGDDTIEELDKKFSGNMLNTTDVEHNWELASIAILKIAENDRKRANDYIEYALSQNDKPPYVRVALKKLKDIL